MRSFLWVAGFCLAVSVAFAQERDTTYLKEVVVYGLPVTSYATGAKVQKIISGENVSTLADGLTGEASLYLKTYGNGQLTTISLRGTNASQTAVLWNGVNINSPTLGQTDFSLIPLFLFDEATLHYGTASSLYGSDAIGGSVMMGQAAPTFGKTFRAGLYQQVGSFGRSATGIKASYGNERLHFRTKVYRAYIRNDFSFDAPAIGHRKKQSHASVTNAGFDQQVYIRLSARQTLSAELMYTDNFREVQPAVTNDLANETIQDRNLRAALNYNNDAAWAVIHATAAYASADQEYTDDAPSTVRTGLLAIQTNADKPLGAHSNLRLGINYNHYSATSVNFDHLGESRYDAFASYRYAIAAPWIININIRQSFYDQHYAPLSPSVGTEVYLRKTEKSQLTVRALSSRGFRVPTLNDRYYIPGGNSLIKPEEAIHAEGGVMWSEKFRNAMIKVDATFYQSWIDEMIVWMPAVNDDLWPIGTWTPSNLQKVNVRGTELSLRAENVSQRVKVTGGASYSFTQSLNKNGISADQNNNQLPYVPLHSANAFTSISNRSNWKLEIRYQYTGLRHSNLDNVDYQAQKSYGLLDFSIGKKQTFGKWSAEAKIDAKNLADVYYENLKNHAMPGRNYALSLLFNF